MEPLTKFKSPCAILDYQINWSIWMPAGDTLSSVCWVVPGGLTQVSTASNTASHTATIFLSGGTACEVYSVINKIATSGSRTNTQTFYLRIMDT